MGSAPAASSAGSEARAPSRVGNGVVERAVAVLLLRLRLGTPAQQCQRLLFLAERRGEHQRRALPVVFRIRVRAGFEARPHGANRGVVEELDSVPIRADGRRRLRGASGEKNTRHEGGHGESGEENHRLNRQFHADKEKTQKSLDKHATPFKVKTQLPVLSNFCTVLLHLGTSW